LLVACNAALVLAFLGAGWALSAFAGVVFGLYATTRL